MQKRIRAAPGGEPFTRPFRRERLWRGRRFGERNGFRQVSAGTPAARTAVPCKGTASDRNACGEKVGSGQRRGIRRVLARKKRLQPSKLRCRLFIYSKYSVVNASVRCSRLLLPVPIAGLHFHRSRLCRAMLISIPIGHSGVRCRLFSAVGVSAQCPAASRPERRAKCSVTMGPTPFTGFPRPGGWRGKRGFLSAALSFRMVLSYHGTGAPSIGRYTEKNAEFSSFPPLYRAALFLIYYI